VLYSSARLSRDRLERELLKHKTLLNIVLNSIKLACTANQPPSYFTKVSQASDCATRAPPADQAWGPLIHHKQELPFSCLTVMKYETSRFHCFCRVFETPAVLRNCHKPLRFYRQKQGSDNRVQHDNLNKPTLRVGSIEITVKRKFSGLFKIFTRL